MKRPNAGRDVLRSSLNSMRKAFMYKCCAGTVRQIVAQDRHLHMYLEVASRLLQFRLSPQYRAPPKSLLIPRDSPTLLSNKATLVRHAETRWHPSSVDPILMQSGFFGSDPKVGP